jgi:hypothetical protein
MQEGSGSPAAGIISTRRSSSRRDLASSAGGTIVMTEPRSDSFACDGLETLLDAPDLTTREAERLARLLAAIDQGGAPPCRASTARRTSTA